jgi:hypothetical protein
MQDLARRGCEGRIFPPGLLGDDGLQYSIGEVGYAAVGEGLGAWVGDAGMVR